jgi:hypothetical protein
MLQILRVRCWFILLRLDAWDASSRHNSGPCLSLSPTRAQTLASTSAPVSDLVDFRDRQRGSGQSRPR